MELVPLTDDQLRSRRSLKWSRAHPGLLPADVAEADFAVAEPIRDQLAAMVAHSDLGYPDFDSPQGGPRRLAEVFAGRLHGQFGVPAEPGRVEVCAQIMQAMCCAILAYSEPGDLILFHHPTYPPIARAVKDLERRPVTVPVPGRDDSGEIDLPATSPGERVALIILCNPHNPTGRIFTPGQLGALAALAEKFDSVIFTDEIHQDLTYDAPHRSVAAVAAAADRTVLFTSAGKSYNIPGLRCAVGYFGSEILLQKFRNLPWHLRSGASLLGIEATVTAWSACDPWLAEFRGLLRRNRSLIENFLADRMYQSPDATYFSWIGLSAAQGDIDPVSRLRAEKNISLQRGSDFGKIYRDFGRLNFAVPENRLQDALSRIFPSAG